MVFVRTSKPAIEAAAIGSFVMSREIKKVSAVPTALQLIAFNADLRLVTFICHFHFSVLRLDS